ncbi:MAG TPA: DUF5615 family PIN-like protein [Pyrinomonadaceae bacterium]|nr:DUF5615 family PIN-like protein [Pyrinomonadaceae bacterium]
MMRVLLDECLPRKLKSDVRADVVKTVPEMGWASIENGALLHLAELEFDVFLTRDKSLEFQQNLAAFDLAVIVLVAATNDIEDLRPLMDAVNATILSIRPTEVMYVGN